MESISSTEQVDALSEVTKVHNDAAMPSYAVLGGVALMFLQTTMSIYGITLQRLGHMRAKEVTKGLCKVSDFPWWRRPRLMWWMGIVSYLASQFIMPFSLALAPMSLLAALSCCQIPVNLFFAYLILAEDITRKDVLASVVSGGFAAGVLAFGPKDESGEIDEIASVAEIFDNMSGWGLVYVIGMMCISAIFLVLFIFRKKWEWIKFQQRTKFFIVPWLHTSLSTIGLIFTKGLGTQLLRLQTVIETTGEIWDPLLQLLLAISLIAATSPTSMYFQVVATQEFDNRWFVPVEFSLCVTLQMFMGAAVFNEWDGLPAWRILVRFCFLKVIIFLKSNQL